MADITLVQVFPNRILLGRTIHANASIWQSGWATPEFIQLPIYRRHQFILIWANSWNHLVKYAEERCQMAKRRKNGEGTIFYSRSHGLWVARITLPNGKRRAKTSKSQKVVKEWLLSQREALHKGIWVESDKVTLSEFIDRYFTNVTYHKVRPSTLQAYERSVRLHIDPELGNIRVIHLSPEKIQDFYSAKMNQGYSRSYVHNLHVIIHSCLKHAQRLGLVNRNVAKLVEAPSPTSSTPQTLSLEQVQKLLAAVNKHRYYALYALAVSTGLRQGELLGLMWEDIDFFSGTIHVQRSLQYLQEKGLSYAEPTTEKGKRSLAVPGFVLDALWDLKEKTGDQSGLVFHTRNNAPIFAKNINCHLKKLLKENDLPLIRFYDLRHTAATLLLSGGVHPKVVQEMLGHALADYTFEIYSHVIPDIQRSAAEKMDDLLE